MADTIRDVLIRIAIESQMASAKKDLDEISSSADNAVKSIKELNQDLAAQSHTTQVQQRRDTVGSMASAPKDKIPTAAEAPAQQAKRMLDDMLAANEAAIDAAEAANGMATASIAAASGMSAQATAATTTAVATTSLGGSSQAAAAAIAGIAPAAAVAVPALLAIVVGVVAISTALREAKESNKRYWDEMAADAEASALRTTQRASIHAQLGLQQVSARTDITSVTGASERLDRQAEVEAEIRRQQAAPGDRPLAERQEVRQRLERRSHSEERGTALGRSVETLEKRRAELSKAREELEGNLPGLHANMESAKRARKQSIEGQRATTLGAGLEGIADWSFGGMKPAKDAADWVAGKLGATTKRQATLTAAQNQEAGKAAEVTATQALDTAQRDHQNILKEEVEINSQIATKKAEQLTLTREQVKATREAAEASQDQLISAQASYGALSTGQKRQFDRVAKKLAAGGKLSHHERQIAKSVHGSDIEENVRRMEAEEGRKSGHFTKQEARVKRQQEEANVAQQAQIKQEPGLAEGIKEAAKRAEDAQKDLIESFEPLTKLVDHVQTLKAELANFKRRVEQVIFDQNMWF